LQSKLKIKNVNRYSEKDRPKVKVHTWLVWQKKTEMPMILTIKNSEYIFIDNETCGKFVTWLKKLFVK
jgi:hypothetical protein